MATGRPDRETWRALMKPALRIVDSLPLNGYGDLDFRLGGGTVLMFRFDHRISKDIDLFIDDAQALGFISPRLNDVAMRESTDYQEQANAIKLSLADGDIDFIAAGTVLPDEALETLNFEGRTITVDPVSEILAKKMLYRAASFKARDVFDLSAALLLDPAAASRAIMATRPAHATLLRRLAALSSVAMSDLVADMRLTATGNDYVPGMLDRVMVAIAGEGHGHPEAVR